MSRWKTRSSCTNTPCLNPLLQIREKKCKKKAAWASCQTLTGHGDPHGQSAWRTYERWNNSVGKAAWRQGGAAEVRQGYGGRPRWYNGGVSQGGSEFIAKESKRKGTETRAQRVVLGELGVSESYVVEVRTPKKHPSLLPVCVKRDAWTRLWTYTGPRWMAKCARTAWSGHMRVI